MQGNPICSSNLTANLMFRLRRVQRDVANMDPQECNNKCLVPLIRVLVCLSPPRSSG